MSQAGHRVSQLPQRLPDTLRREGLKGQAAAAGSFHSCPCGYVSQPWVCWLLLQKSCRWFLPGPCKNGSIIAPRTWEVPCVTREGDLNSGCPHGCGERLGTDIALLKIGSLLGFQLIRPSLPLGGMFMIYLEKSLPGSQKTMIFVFWSFGHKSSTSFKLVISELGLGFLICKMKEHLFTCKALENDLAFVLSLDVSVLLSYLAF